MHLNAHVKLIGEIMKTFKFPMFALCRFPLHIVNVNSGFRSATEFQF